MDGDYFLIETDDLDVSFLQALHTELYDIPDDEDVIFKAYEASMRTDSVSPLVKPELRLSKGREELTADYPSVCCEDAKELPSEDLCRRERRKFQNRTSAQKYRSKKKDQERNLKKTLDCLRSENSDLQDEVIKLHGEILMLKDAITQHH